MENKFAFIGHPSSTGMLHKYISLYKKNYSEKKMNDTLLKKLFEWTPSFKAFDIELERTGTSKKISGAFYAASFLPETMIESPHLAVAKIEEALRAAEKDGMTVAALGALTSIADGAQGEIVSKAVKSMAVTNGSTFTSALVIEGINRICDLLDIDQVDLKMVIVGATGSIGKTCSRYFSGKVGQLTLTGRNQEKLNTLFSNLKNESNSEIYLTTDNKKAVADADIIISVTSSVLPIFESSDFKRGAIVCDVGFPKNIAASCIDRPDIIVYSGGLAKIPGKIKNATIWGLPSDDIIYGCFSESMVIAMEGCTDYCVIGHSDITLENVQFIADTARRHGFQIAPFFNNSRYYTDNDFRLFRNIIKNSEKQKAVI